MFVERVTDAMYYGAAHGSSQGSVDTFDLANQKDVSFPVTIMKAPGPERFARAEAQAPLLRLRRV